MALDPDQSFLNTFDDIINGEIDLADLATTTDPRSLSKYLPAALNASDAAFRAAVKAGIPLPTETTHVEHVHKPDLDEMVEKCYELGISPVVKPDTETLSRLLSDSIKSIRDGSVGTWVDVTIEQYATWARMIADGAVIESSAMKELRLAKRTLKATVDMIDQFLVKDDKTRK